MRKISFPHPATPIKQTEITKIISYLPHNINQKKSASTSSSTEKEIPKTITSTKEMTDDIKPDIPDIEPKTEPLKNLNLSTWIWKSPTYFNSSNLKSTFDFLKARGVSTVYLEIDAYIDIYELKDSPNKDKLLNTFNEKLENFVAYAHQSNIQVVGLAGDTNWYQDEYFYITEELIKYIAAYNSSASPNERLSGLQLDVEPQSDKDFKQDKIGTLTQYLNYVEKTTTLAKTKIPKEDLMLTIPYGFNDKNSFTINFNNKKETVFLQLLDILKTKQNSTLIIMAYRNFSDGVNGTIDLARDEFDSTQNDSRNVKLIIGQETGDFEPSKITFFGKDKQTFENEISKISNFFSQYKNFDGLAIHDIDGYERLYK